MPQRLQVVPTRLFPSEMSVDGHVPGSTGQRFTFAIWDMSFSLGVTVVLCHAEIYDVNDIGVLRPGNAD